MGTGVIINIISFNVGTYPISLPNNIFVYIDNSDNQLVATSGSVNITGNSNNLLTGNFEVTVLTITGTQKIVIGKFIDISIYG